MTPPLITVLLPVFNAAAHLREAIQSVLDQSHADFELLVIDDGSTDESPMIPRSFSDARIRVLTHERNQGLIASLNEGLSLAQGRYIARMDADDVMHPLRLAKQFDLLEAQPETAVLASLVETINADGEPIGVWDTDRACVSEQEIRSMMPKTNCIAHPSVMIRRSALGDLRYAKGQAGAEDWDLWLRMLSRGKRIMKIPEPLLEYRLHAQSAMGAAKRTISLERRLLSTRGRYLLRELAAFRFNRFNGLVFQAQVRTLARMFRNAGLHFVRDTGRALSYRFPFREKRLLARTLATWNGRHVFLFPYLNVGGAEQVHADILATIKDQDPLVIICGFSRDRGFEERFRKSATVIELPRLLNHPWTRRAACRAIATKLNGQGQSVLFSSLTRTFFDLLPLLRKDARTFWLQHAFLHQPGGNLQHKHWLAHFDRVNNYLFVSEHARLEFGKFLHANAVTRDDAKKLLFLPNAVHRFLAPQAHDRISVLFVGRDSREKRVDLFLELVRRVHQVHPGRFAFTLVGVARASTPLVTFHGRIDDPAALSAVYAAHDILTVTSYREGFPMVIMEAMAHGLAILSTPVGDVPNRVTDAFAVLTSSVEPEVVVSELIAALEALDQDRARLDAMRKAAFAKATAEYGWDAFRERYRSVLISPASATSASNR